MTESTNVVQGEESATSWFTTYTVFARKDDAAAKSDADTTRDSQNLPLWSNLSRPTASPCAVSTTSPACVPKPTSWCHGINLQKRCRKPSDRFAVLACSQPPPWHSPRWVPTASQKFNPDACQAYRRPPSHVNGCASTRLSLLRLVHPGSRRARPSTAWARTAGSRIP